MLGKIFERFVERSPISVMTRGLLERLLNPKTIDDLFERVADRQYTRNLLFSVVVDLMSQVVCGSHKTLHAAYQASAQEISVSVTSLYNRDELKVRELKEASPHSISQWTAYRLFRQAVNLSLFSAFPASSARGNAPHLPLASRPPPLFPWPRRRFGRY